MRGRLPEKEVIVAGNNFTHHAHQVLDDLEGSNPELYAHVMDACDWIIDNTLVARQHAKPLRGLHNRPYWSTVVRTNDDPPYQVFWEIGDQNEPMILTVARLET